MAQQQQPEAYLYSSDQFKSVCKSETRDGNRKLIYFALSKATSYSCPLENDVTDGLDCLLITGAHELSSPAQIRTQDS